ncbi:hypothetical protein [Haloprofundus halobius]|uniref:hypothetical protein n=1 Tax=Haloprofundus halobius TaxID=2876194 RepID=UPI001CC8FCFC|nr:hypothetical protein [Haloprofundus halobius]
MNPFAAIVDRLIDGDSDVSGGPYQCRSCGEGYALEYHVCPTCGGYSVESEYNPVAEFNDDSTS